MSRLQSEKDLDVNRCKNKNNHSVTATLDSDISSCIYHLHHVEDQPAYSARRQTARLEDEGWKEQARPRKGHILEDGSHTRPVPLGGIE